MKLLKKISGRLVDRLFFLCFFLSLCLILFVGGSWAVYKHFRFTDPLIDAFNSGEEWIRDATQDFNNTPAMEMASALKQAKVSWNSALASNGYTLITLWGTDDSAYLINMDGKIVYSWSMPFTKVWPHPKQTRGKLADNQAYWEAAYAMPNGDLLAIYCTMSETPYGLGIVKLDKNSRVIWSYDGNAHHELYIDKTNGTIYTLVQEFIKKPIHGFESLHYPVLSDAIAILSPDGTEIKRIPLIEAFLNTPYELLLYHASMWDFSHANSVMKLEPDIASTFPMFKAGQILVSIRNMSTLAVIDPDSQKVVWATEGLWKRQHAAHFLPNGHILLLDNHGHQINRMTYSRILEVDPANMGVVWSYAGSAEAPFFTSIVGRVQRLPNGNTLIAESLSGRIFEVTKEGQIVWNYVLPAKWDRWGKMVKDSTGSQVVVASATRYAPDSLPFLNNVPAVKQ